MDTIALDTETTGLKLHNGKCQPFYISTCNTEGMVRSWRFQVDPFTRKVQIPRGSTDEVLSWLDNKRIVFHNAKFDIRALSTIGINLEIDSLNFEETHLASHAIKSEGTHKLKELALLYLDYPDIDEKKLKAQVIRSRHIAKGKGWKISEKTEEDYWLPGQINKKESSLEKYADQDAERTILLWLLFEPLLKKLNLQEGYEREKELLRTVYKMENEGITINTEKLESSLTFFHQEKAKSNIRANYVLRKRFNKTINLDSGKQLINILHDKKGYNLEPAAFTEKGGISTDKDSLNTLYNASREGSSEERFIYHLLMGRAYKSGVGYLEGYKRLATPLNGTKYAILYPSLNQSGTRTTRFSSNNPNGQNIGKKTDRKVGDEKFTIPKLRDVFGPLPGQVWYAIDYSQLELRVFSAVSKEQSLIDVLDEGYDFHGYVACRIFNKKREEVTDQERTIAKNVNFALLFGASPRKVNQTAGIPNAYELFSGQFPNANKFMQKIIKEVSKTGYIRTVDGYRLDVPLKSPYKAVNYLVQGSAGSIVKNAMIDIDKEDWFDWEQIRLVLQIHDELIIEVNEDSKYNSPKYINRIMNIMLNSGLRYGINTPASCELITTDWGHGQEINVTETEFSLAA